MGVLYSRFAPSSPQITVLGAVEDMQKVSNTDINTEFDRIYQKTQLDLREIQQTVCHDIAHRLVKCLRQNPETMTACFQFMDSYRYCIAEAFQNHVEQFLEQPEPQSAAVQQLEPDSMLVPKPAPESDVRTEEVPMLLPSKPTKPLSRMVHWTTSKLSSLGTLMSSFIGATYNKLRTTSSAWMSLLMPQSQLSSEPASFDLHKTAHAGHQRRWWPFWPFRLYW